MTVYTVHEPPPGKREKTPSRERIQFVRDGFYFWAFLFGPLWMLWRRMWLVLVIYLAALGATQFLLWALEAPSEAKWIVSFLIALLIGFEAGSLRRWSLSRWRERGIVVAPNLEMAERRFFEIWPAPRSSSQLSPPAAPPPAQSAPVRGPAADTDVIGLFPEPEPRR
jgi:hypothetical protein